MLTTRDCILLPVTDDMIIRAVEYSLTTHFHDNLRSRHLSVRLDSIIRGKIGELALRAWLEHNGISVATANLPSEMYSPDTDLLINAGTLISCEIKTSLIPDSWYDLHHTLQQADIKIIKRERHFSEIHCDIHVQLFFNFYRDKRDNWLRSLPIISSNLSTDTVIDTLQLGKYRDQTFFAAWIDKKTLVHQLHEMTEPIWYFGKREFWKCKITTQAKRPAQLPDFLRQE